MTLVSSGADVIAEPVWHTLESSTDNGSADHRLNGELTEAEALFVNLESSQSVVRRLSQQADAVNVETSTDDNDNGLQVAGSQGIPEGGGEFDDRLYIVREGERIQSIAQDLTGDADNWRRIAAYNDLGDPKTLQVGQILLIPQSLLREKKPAGRKSDNVRAASLVTPSIVTEISPVISAQEALARVQQNNEGESTVLHSSNVDMFAGEVRVMGSVAVNRVAVGNGAIIRAEVLANGELLTIAQAAGSTSLHLWHEDGKQTDYNIRVSATDPEARVRPEKMIRMRVKMVEFRKSALSRLGIDWGDSVAGPIFATAGDAVTNPIFRPAQDAIAQTLPNAIRPFSSYFGIASQLTSRINFLVTSGDAEMLAEPVLSCSSGGSAKFLAGGEVPYPSVAANGQTTVEFKEYGIRLEVAPVADQAGGVQTTILTEISSIDPALTIQGAPGLLTRRTETQVNARAGDTIVIAGLLQSDNSKDIDRLPGIGKLPVIGKLFASENVRNNVSELVIFITPEVVDPMDNRLTESQERVHRYSRELLGSARQDLQYNLLD